MKMPPIRGHDLKHKYRYLLRLQKRDAPHTGARLETQTMTEPQRQNNIDAPHTGARLETLLSLTGMLLPLRCPPYGGTT